MILDVLKWCRRWLCEQAGIPIGGYWYYFDSYGIMKTGLQTIAGSLYYLGGSNDLTR